ncbi:MAG TPA: lysophospholipid acyltransferase family protein [bacterium]|nr:lysophospholipid acyltransferase family protein [bacterium]HPR86538.1 lysophospholipid acyltransferase family protein [bacterium]
MDRKNKDKLVFYLATRFAWLLLLFFGITGRIRVRNRRYWNQLAASGEGFIAVPWHGKMVAPLLLHRNLGVVVMVSEHRDGEMIAQTVHRLGYRTVRGSSTRGGRQAFREMLKALRARKVCCILPDGPRGPRQVLKSGVLILAMRSGCPILPMTFAASRPITLHSWDRFTLWWPFARVSLIYGKPFRVPPGLEGEALEQFRIAAERRMVQLEEEADGFFR